MKRTLIITALFLGFSVVGFSQATEEVSEATVLNATYFGGSGNETIAGKIVVQDRTTGNLNEVVIENPNVIVVPSETVIIKTHETSKIIVVKASGESIGSYVFYAWSYADLSDDTEL